MTPLISCRYENCDEVFTDKKSEWVHVIKHIFARDPAPPKTDQLHVVPQVRIDGACCDKAKPAPVKCVCRIVIKCSEHGLQHLGSHE